MLWFYEMHAPRFRRENTPGKPLLAIVGDARSRPPSHRCGLAHLDHRGPASEALKLEPLVTRQQREELPLEFFRAREPPSQKPDGGGNAALSQERLDAAARGIRGSASCSAGRNDPTCHSREAWGVV